MKRDLAVGAKNNPKGGESDEEINRNFLWVPSTRPGPLPRTPPHAEKSTPAPFLLDAFL